MSWKTKHKPERNKLDIHLVLGMTVIAIAAMLIFLALNIQLLK